MPIRGLSEKRRLPRAGKIKLGVMVQGRNGTMYPRATDYFVCPQEILDALKVDQPLQLRELPIMFPTDDPALIFPQALKMYRASGLFCAGDGETAKRWHEGELVEMRCPCDYLESGECGAVATLNFLLPDVPGIGVWQIDTGNKTTITEVNSALEQFHATFGGLRGIPFLLKLEPRQTQRYDEKHKEMVKTTIHVLKLDSPFSLRQIVEWRAKQGKVVEALMPIAEHGDEVKALEAGTPEPDATQQSAPEADSKLTREADRSPQRDSVSQDPEQTAAAQRTAESGAPVAREPQPDRPADAPWDISMCFAVAKKCDVSPDLYERYLKAVYGTNGIEMSDANVAKERARFEPLTIPGDKRKTEVNHLAHKAVIIRDLNEALKRKGTGK